MSLADFARILKHLVSSECDVAAILRSVAEYSAVEHYYCFSSGRAALFYLLKALSRTTAPDRSEVVIPAYTCFSVAAAAVKAGLKIRLVDIDIGTLDYSNKALQNATLDHAFCMIACNLFGITNNWDSLDRLAERQDLFLIDDAAQSFGSILNGSTSGTFGDAGFFSLGRGKSLSAYSGGILITQRKSIAAAIEQELICLPRQGAHKTVTLLMSLLGSSMLLHPRKYWVTGLMPFLKLGESVFEPDFEAAGMNKLQKCAFAVQFRKLAGLCLERQRKCLVLQQRLADLKSYGLPGFREDFCPSYLRMPVLASSKHTRNQIIARLRQCGIVSASMYPSTIRDIKRISDYIANPGDVYPNAQRVVECLFTLPTHAYVTNRDIDKIVECLRGFA